MKLLLINPKFPESFWSFKWAIDNILPDKRTVNPPLGLATLAASDKAAGIIDFSDDALAGHFEAGAQFVAVGADVTFLSRGLQALAQKWKPR